MWVLCTLNSWYYFAEFLPSASIALSSSVVMKFLSGAVFKTYFICCRSLSFRQDYPYPKVLCNHPVSLINYLRAVNSPGGRLGLILFLFSRPRISDLDAEENILRSSGLWIHFFGKWTQSCVCLPFEVSKYLLI